MKPTWKPVLFILLLNLLFPVLLGVSLTFNTPIRLSWLSLVAIAHSWQLCRITLPFFMSPLRYLPQPDDVSFWFGHKSLLMGSAPGVEALKVMEATSNDGLILVRGYAHYRTRLVPTSPPALKDFLTTRAADFRKPAILKDSMEKIVGKGLVSSEGYEHMRQRKAVAPAFYGQHIRNLVPIFWRKATAMAEVADRKQVKGNGIIEICDLASQVTLDIIGEAALGRDLNSMEICDDKLVQLYQTISTDARPLLQYFICSTYLPRWLMDLLPLKGKRIVSELDSSLHRLAHQMVQDKKGESESRKTDGHDILSILLHKNRQDDQDLAEQLLTFLFAGHETTASAFSWSVLCLARDSGIQERLRTELTSHLGACYGKSVDAATLESIPFLEAVSNEVLRLYPPVPQTVREAICDTEIDGTIVPRGMLVIVSAWAINRLTKFWGKEASSFVPDRWIRSDGSFDHLGGAPNKYCMQSFLHGPKACIGESFARAELKCLIAALLLRFRLELADPDEEPVPCGVITIKPADGLRVRLTRL